MAELGRETVEFKTLVSRAAEDSFVSLKELVEQAKSGELSDTEKKVSLLKYVVKTQQRMLRLNVLSKWCQQVPLIQYCQQLQSTLSSHDTCFTQAADSLFFMHEGLQQARAPVYDVPSAIEVMLTGSYERLPKCMEEVGMQSSLTEEQQKPALKKLDILVRSKLLGSVLPREFSEVKVSDGTATIRVEGEFKVLVTLGYRGHLSMWRILHLELLVGERSGPVKLEQSRRHALGDDLERRMSVSDNPFSTLYSILHELCIALVMDTVIRQVQVLRQWRWKEAIRFELISDSSAAQGRTPGSVQASQDGEAEVGRRTPGLKLIYWLALDKNSSSSDSSSCPHIRIEPGPDLQIKYLHSKYIIDPLTGKQAEFSLDQSCIDVENLLLRAIFCDRYTRLLEIEKELVKNVQICRSMSDVVLQSHLEEPGVDKEKKENKSDARENEGPDLLCVRAYGSLFFTLGINIRNGRFILKSSRRSLNLSALAECEEALNQGTKTAADVFTSLRSKSILHLFASIGGYLGLEVYEDGSAAAKLPRNISTGSNILLIGLPNRGSSYYLLMELDRDFKPMFKLIEMSQSDSSGRAYSSNDVTKASRTLKIDMNQMLLRYDELNSNIIHQEDLLPSLRNTREGPYQTSESGLLSRFNTEGSLQVSGRSSSFSSIIDEVFEVEKETSAALSTIQNPSSYKASTGPHFGSVPLKIRGSGTGNASPKLQGDLQPLDVSPMDEDHPRFVNDSSQDALMGTVVSRLLSPSGPALPRVAASSAKTLSGARNAIGYGTLSSPSISPTADPASSKRCYDSTSSCDKNSRKRTISNLLHLIPSLKHIDSITKLSKRQKTIKSTPIQCPSSQNLLSGAPVPKTDERSYGDLIAEANKGNAPSSVYLSALSHVIRHCSLCIKIGRLSSQMDALDIPYGEEISGNTLSPNLWFKLPFVCKDSWQTICLRLGKPGSMDWDVKINDQHFRDLWELQKGSKSTPWGSGVRIANTSDADFHIRYDPEGVILHYESVEDDSIKQLVADIKRLANARMFSLEMRKLLGVRTDESAEESNDIKSPRKRKGSVETTERLSEQMRRAFRIEAVGLMSLWFSFGSNILARFVVEWERDKDGCTMRVSPDQLWPHTKFLEDFINGAEVASLLDCIRLTAGPLHALAAATRPARSSPAAGVSGLPASLVPVPKQSGYMQTQGLLSNSSNANVNQASVGAMANAVISVAMGSIGHHGLGPAMSAGIGRAGPGIVPSSLLPIDVSVVLRGPYWIRIIYRKRFAVDMRCFSGDQVWLQPATPPKGGSSVGGSLPCPQFRPFIMEHVAQELNSLEPNFTGGQHTLGLTNLQHSLGPSLASANGNRVNFPTSAAISRAANQVAGLNRSGYSVSGSPSAAAGLGLPIRRTPATGVPAHVRGELNTAIIGLGDDGGYGGGWVPLVALKKVLRGILKYLGVLWLFAQLPDLLKEILGSILKENEGTLLNLDQEQPALRFFVGGYVFAVSVHRVQLLLQVLSVKRLNHNQQQQNTSTVQEELTPSEIGEICDYFSRRVASEPYDASRVASFITLLTLPISVLREFLKLIAWKKGLAAQAQSGSDVPPAQKPRIELCLENHTGFVSGEEPSVTAKSNIHYDRPRNSVDFVLTVVLDPAHIPHINAAGGAAWLPHCVSVRLRYLFGETPSVTFLEMEGSHGGRACWVRHDDWEKCKQRVARTVEATGASTGDATQGRLRVVADSIQRTLQSCLQGLRDGGGAASGDR